MAVAQLFYHVAPRSELNVVAKPLIRLLRAHSEVQSVVLQNVATMTLKRKVCFIQFYIPLAVQIVFRVCWYGIMGNELLHPENFPIPVGYI